MQGIVTAPILFAIEEFPELRPIVDRGFDKPGDVDLVSPWYLRFFTLLLSIYADTVS